MSNQTLNEMMVSFSKLKRMPFGAASFVTMTTPGAYMIKSEWAGYGVTNDTPIIKCQLPDDLSKMTEPYLYVEVGSMDRRVPWSPSSADITEALYDVVMPESHKE